MRARVFGTLECELPGRRHSALGYKSPIDDERSASEGLETDSL
jgi:hypothetical protein